MLIAEVLPGQLFGVQTATREEAGHGLQGSLLRPAGAGGQAGEVHLDRVLGGVSDWYRFEVVGDGGSEYFGDVAGNRRKGFCHTFSLARTVILISSLPHECHSILGGGKVLRVKNDKRRWWYRLRDLTVTRPQGEIALCALSFGAAVGEKVCASCSPLVLVSGIRG